MIRLDGFFELPAIFKDPTNPVDAADAKELTELRDQLQDDFYEDMDDLGAHDESRMERQARKECMKDREKRGRYIRKRIKWLCKATYEQRKEAQEREKRKEEEERAAVTERQRERDQERAHHDTEEGMNLLGQSNMIAYLTEGDDLGFQLDEYS